jgi:hypothetical protein
MNEPILFASISAIVLLGSIQIAMATIHNYYLDCYKQGKFDALHGLAFNDTASMHCAGQYVLAFNQYAYHLN